MSLVVGIDAVTTRDTLVQLQELERRNDLLRVQVFSNPTPALFHPKVARFEYPDGRRCLIVGSGNLTPGGLRQNFEAFSVMRAAENENLDASSWDRFLGRYSEVIHTIDEKALERAAQNILHGRRRRDVESGRGAAALPSSGTVAAAEVEQPVGRTDRFLVARVPRAGNRWRQVHFNVDVIAKFFRVQPGTEQRVCLRECRQDGTFAEPEVRPCIYSDANKNLKIEIASHPGEPYPDAGTPITVYRELQTRSFAYMLLMPGDTGHDPMFSLTETLPSTGPGVRRVVTNTNEIRGYWPTCPLIRSIDSLAESTF